MKKQETKWNLLLDEGTYYMIYNWVVDSEKYTLCSIPYNKFDNIIEEANEKDLRISEISNLFIKSASNILEDLKTEPCVWGVEGMPDGTCETLEIIQKHIILGNIRVNPDMYYVLTLNEDPYESLINEDLIVDDIVYKDLFNWFKTTPNWKDSLKETYEYEKKTGQR